MATTRQFLHKLHTELSPLYGSSEASAMGRILSDYLHRNGLSRADSDSIWTDAIASKADQILSSLTKGQPIQYVLHESWFDGKPFYVDESVLIPRPETEELLYWIRQELSDRAAQWRILEVGTGSGILAVCLKNSFPNAVVTAVDISEAAIRTARMNATKFDADVNFIQLDFTDRERWPSFDEFDLIVSNPPYISEQERESMPRQVVEHEPSIALFVPASDPLLFYRHITAFGKDHLAKEGQIFLEIHEDRSPQTEELLHQMEYNVEVRTDMQGKERMIRASRKV